MKSLLRLNNKLFLFFLYLISVTIISRKISTIVVILFTIYCGLNYSFFLSKNYKKHIKYILVINIPILLEIFFFWNNESYSLGLKSLEKSLVCLIFPFLIIIAYKKIDCFKILKLYSITTLFVLTISASLFIYFKKEYFDKYMNGIHTWQMGYQFSDFTSGIHAPALNMYISFITIYFLYEMMFSFKRTELFKRKFFLYLFAFISSFLFLLIVNTRIALVSLIINIFLLYLYVKIGFKKKIIIGASTLLLLLTISFLFVNKFPFTVEKYTVQLTGNLDKIGELDTIKDPEKYVYSSLVTRISIWQSSYKLGISNFFIGVGSSDANFELINYYKKTNQLFLYKYEFPTHNQFLNYFIKYGIIGFVGCFIYVFYLLYLGIKSKNILIICFFVNFFISNLTDDYLNKFDGIVYSSFWYTIFTCYFINFKENFNEKN